MLHHQQLFLKTCMKHQGTTAHSFGKWNKTYTTGPTLKWVAWSNIAIPTACRLAFPLVVQIQAGKKVCRSWWSSPVGSPRTVWSKNALRDLGIKTESLLHKLHTTRRCPLAASCLQLLVITKLWSTACAPSCSMDRRAKAALIKREGSYTCEPTRTHQLWPLLSTQGGEGSLSTPHISAWKKADVIDLYTVSWEAWKL